MGAVRMSERDLLIDRRFWPSGVAHCDELERAFNFWPHRGIIITDMPETLPRTQGLIAFMEEPGIWPMTRPDGSVGFRFGYADVKLSEEPSHGSI